MEHAGGVHFRAFASGEDRFQGQRVTPVDGETVGLADLHNTGREPAPVAFGEPLGGILADLLLPGS